MMRYLKAACGFVCFLILASNVWTISRWNESRGVYDDICYLRQAHLFQRFGLDGLNTDIARDDDHYLADKLKEIRFPDWNDVAKIPCHPWNATTNKYAIQYPPGTGFVLALFPEGFQVIPLYVLANVTIFGFALLGLYRAHEPAALALAAVFGCVAIYLMINPAKASYSAAPTMMVCALAGLLTARLFTDAPRHRLARTALVGLVIGLGVNFRLANLFLSGGYFLYFAGRFLMARNRESFLQGLSFGAAFVVGMAPTLMANAINAGSPFATTYGPDGAIPPGLNVEVLRQYLTDAQFALLAVAAAWTAWLWRSDLGSARQVALLVAVNIAVNLIFFVTYPIFTPYYIVPIDMLSLWTLLFATLGLRGQAAPDKSTFRQSAGA